MVKGSDVRVRRWQRIMAHISNCKIVFIITVYTEKYQGKIGTLYLHIQTSTKEGEMVQLITVKDKSKLSIIKKYGNAKTHIKSDEKGTSSESK